MPLDMTNRSHFMMFDPTVLAKMFCNAHNTWINVYILYIICASASTVDAGASPRHIEYHMLCPEDSQRTWETHSESNGTEDKYKKYQADMCHNLNIYVYILLYINTCPRAHASSFVSGSMGFASENERIEIRQAQAQVKPF